MIKVFIRLYEQLYYRLYIAISKVDTGNDHHITAAILCSCVKVLILLWTYAFGRYYGYRVIFETNNVSDEVVFVTAVCVGLINIYFFTKNKRYKKIINEYSKIEYRVSNIVIDTCLGLLILSLGWFALVID